MVRHIVLFALSKELSETQKYNIIVQIQQAFHQLPARIEGLQSLQIEHNINPQEPFDFALIATLNSFEDLQHYANNPEHKALVQQLIAPHVAQRACVDYLIDQK